MTPDEMLMHKVRDLEGRMNSDQLANASSPQYELIMAAPLLREILMGSPPLIHLANKERRLKIAFTVAALPAFEQKVMEMKPSFYTRADGLHPHSNMPQAVTAERNLSQFLREMVMVVEGETVTVRDLVDYLSNAGGAVHFGDQDRGRRAVVAEVEKTIGLGGVEAPTRMLLGIGRVTADALGPLVSQIETDRADQN